jgi:predicted site-specific integrase-resolvase
MERHDGSSLPKEFITEKELSRRTGIGIQTLRNWRHIGKGFKYVKLGRAVRYPWQDAQDYMRARIVDPEGRSC